MTKRGLRVIVCGGRKFGESEDEQERIWQALGDLDDELGIALVAHGGATGADSEAGAWATHMRKPAHVFPARWKEEGRAAGPLRNQRMLDTIRPDALVAFPGGRGTADMIRRAESAGVRVIRG